MFVYVLFSSVHTRLPDHFLGGNSFNRNSVGRDAGVGPCGRWCQHRNKRNQVTLEDVVCSYNSAFHTYSKKSNKLQLHLRLICTPR